MAKTYRPDSAALALSAQSIYEAPAGDQIVFELDSGVRFTYYVAGVVEVEGVSAAREVVAISYKKLAGGGAAAERVVLGSGTSDSDDGSFAINVGEYADPVLVIAMDDYGETWSASTMYEAGDIVHPATSEGYQGFVYECTSGGLSGNDEPDWWIDNGSIDTGKSGNAVFRARQYFQPLSHGPVLPAKRTEDE